MVFCGLSDWFSEFLGFFVVSRIGSRNFLGFLWSLGLLLGISWVFCGLSDWLSEFLGFFVVSRIDSRNFLGFLLSLGLVLGFYSDILEIIDFGCALFLRYFALQVRYGTLLGVILALFCVIFVFRILEVLDTRYRYFHLLGILGSPLWLAHIPATGGLPVALYGHEDWACWAWSADGCKEPSSARAACGLVLPYFY